VSNQGFIKIERGIVDHWVFKSDPECRIWIYLIILVKFSNSNKPVKIGKVERILDRGEFISSISKIAAELDLTYNQVRRCLDLFKKNNMIVKTCGRGKGIPYVAKLVNYEKWQGDYTFKKAIKTDGLFDIHSISEKEAHTAHFVLEYVFPDAKYLLDDAALVVQCTGFRANLPKISLNGVTQKVRQRSNFGELSDIKSGRSIPNLFGFGLGIQIIPEGDYRGEKSFNGSSDGVLPYPNAVAPVIIDQLIHD
jgi:hypothetical protein